MKIAVSGKGGVGKTTVCVHLAKYLADAGQEVILVDADPDANLALALGLPEEQDVLPITELKELINERTGANETDGKVFRLNPEVSDIPEQYSVKIGNIKLLRLGNLKPGGAGCYCPEGAFLKALVNHLFLNQDQVVIIDMEAGIEHLGRASAKGVDIMLVVVEPGTRAVQTASTVRKCAADIGLKNIAVVINKFRDAEELSWTEEKLKEFKIVGALPYDSDIALADRQGVCAYTGKKQQFDSVDNLYQSLRKSLL